ncbi:MAG: ABC1 kinase family protein [Thermoleophilia bacterium]
MAAIIDPKKSSLLRVSPRLMQILRVLARHKVLGALRGEKHLPPPPALRETFEELGVTFIKFGQVLAMRSGLLPAAYTDELKLLHDELPPMGFDAVRAAVEACGGAPLTELFSSFSETPLAAASIAQVHEATMRDGRHVAVKVQRPDLEAIISTDIAALTYLAALGERLFPRLRAFDLSAAVREFDKSLHRELDFRREARSIVLFRAALADVPDLWIPGIIAGCSSGTVLALEFSAGERVDLYGKLHPEAMPRTINTLVRLMLQTIFEEGIFHADPHPGNVFVLPDGRLSLLDFGNTGELDEPTRESLARLLQAIVKGDGRAATEAYLEMALVSEGVDQAGLLVDIKAALYEVNRSDLEDVSIGDAFDSLLRAGTRNGVRNSAEIILLSRAFVILESMSRELAPQHNYLESFREEISRLTAKHFSPAGIKEKTTKFVLELERLVSDAPGDTRRALRRIAEGDLGRIQTPALEGLASRVSSNLERLASAITFAALVVGGSMLLIAFAQLGGWHHDLGEIMIIGGFSGMFIIRITAWLRKRGRR